MVPCIQSSSRLCFLSLKESASRVPLAAGLDRATQLAAMTPRYTVGIKGPAGGFFHQKHLQGLFVSFAASLSIFKSRIERKMNECPDPNGISLLQSPWYFSSWPPDAVLPNRKLNQPALLPNQKSRQSN